MTSPTFNEVFWLLRAGDFHWAFVVIMSPFELQLALLSSNEPFWARYIRQLRIGLKIDDGICSIFVLIEGLRIVNCSWFVSLKCRESGMGSKNKLSGKWLSCLYVYFSNVALLWGFKRTVRADLERYILFKSFPIELITGFFERIFGEIGSVWPNC